MLETLAVLAAVWALWTFFLAVMALRRARQAGTLTRAALVLGVPVLVAGYALDVLVNLTLASILFADVPREWTVSRRLARYQGGWRCAAASWIGRNLLDPFDPSGRHVP